MKLRPRHLLVSSFCIASAAAQAAPDAPPSPPVEALTLKQSLERAVSGNLDLRRERLTIAIADANVFAARGAFDFRIEGAATFQRDTVPNLNEMDLSGGFTSSYAGNLALIRPLETGGQVSLSARDTTLHSNQRGTCASISGQRVECTVHSTGVQLNLVHPLLRGFGTDIAMANLRRQRVLKDQALLNRQTRAANVLRDVVTAYWELAYATKDLAIRRSAVELAQEQLRITQAQIEVGRLAKIDEAAVQRAIGERLQEVVIAEQTQYFQSILLRRLLGLSPDPAAPAFSAVDEPAAGEPKVDAAAEISRALEANPQLKSLRLGNALSDIDIETAKSTVLPRLDFVGSLGGTGRSRDSFDDAAEMALKLRQRSWSAGLQFQIPIENRAARGTLQAAQASGQRVALDADTFDLQLRELVLQLGSRITTAVKRVSLSRATVGYAQQNLEAERARFSVGRSTNNDVLLRQQELKAEEIRLLRATVDLLESEVALSAATGDILDRYDVVLKGL